LFRQQIIDGKSEKEIRQSWEPWHEYGRRYERNIYCFDNSGFCKF
jgi:hypothetical protein